MNANELADYLDNCVEAMIITEQPYLDQAATMLRQLQAIVNDLSEGMDRQSEIIRQLGKENEALKAELKLIDELVRGKK